VFKKFVSKAITNVFLDKDARQNLDAKRQVAHRVAEYTAARPNQPRPAASQGGAEALPVSPEALKARLDQQLDSFRRQADAAAEQARANPERATLIQNAMALHQEKNRIFENLSDDERQKLSAIAMTAFLGAGEK